MFGGQLAGPGEAFCVEVASGRVSLRRGAIPPSLLREFGEVVARVPSARGRLVGMRGGGRPRLECHGLPDAVGQRCRNVFGPHASSGLAGSTVRAERRGLDVVLPFALVVVAVAAAVALLGR